MLFDEEILQTFNDSLKRCQADPMFLTLFYQKFVLSNALVREKFANTDMHNQKMMLHASLYMIMLATQENKAANTYLEQIADRHSKTELDITPDLYGFWLESLIEAVSKIDPEYSEDIEQAWRTVMGYGVDYMISKYNSETN